MAHCTPFRIGVVLLFGLVTSVAAARKKSAEPKVYDVKLLVTRHGLSCTNMAQTWIGNLDAGRRNIHDPLLTGAGVFGAQENAKIVAEWLTSKNLKIDAVLSSVLARAMETALVMYPSASPLHIAPFIREYSQGLSNAPIENRQDQTAHLNSTLNKDFQMDYKGIDQYGIEEGNWAQFINFMEQSFLPELVSKLAKPSGSTIVLPVVTHSNFMRDSSVGKKCGSAWKSKGNSKPLNSQVVQMSYSFEIGGSAPDKSRSAVTTTGAGDKKANAMWVQSGEHDGRPKYQNMEDKMMTIQWNEQEKKWQIRTKAKVMFWSSTTTILYQSSSNQGTLPQEGWEPVSSKGPAPTMKFPNTQYKLKLSELPCEDVAPGQATKNSTGKVISPICLKDVGDACISPINKHSWAAFNLWGQTYEKKIQDKRNLLIASRYNILSQEKQYKLLVSQLGDISGEDVEDVEDVEDTRLALIHKLQALAHSMKRARNFVKQTEIDIPKLEQAECWSGGNPDVGGRVPWS